MVLHDKEYSMKRLLFSMLILALTLSLVLGIAVVNAEETTTPSEPTINIANFKKIEADTQFGAVVGVDILYLNLPEGYYAEKVGESGDTVTATYNGVRFTLSKATWNVLSSYPQNAVTPTMSQLQYKPNASLNIKLDADNGRDDVKLYKSAECQISDKIATLTDESAPLTFLNVSTNSKGKLVYLVATSDAKIGYVRADFTNNNAILAIPTPPTPVEKEPVVPDEPDVPVDPSNPDLLPDTGAGESDGTIIKPNEDSEVKPTKNNVVKITLIVAICILSAVLVFLLFKPTRKKSGRYAVEDDEDYDRDDSYQDGY